MNDMPTPQQQPTAEEQRLHVAAYVINKIFDNLDDPRAKVNTGFVLLTFPPNDPIAGCKLIANLSSRDDLMQLFSGLITRFKAEAEAASNV